MIILDTTTKSLEVVLAGSVTATQLPFTAAYVDVTSSGSTLIENDGQTNNAVAVTLVAAPASGAVRVVKQITLQNADTASATATIRLNNSSTLRTLFKATLAVGDQILYAEGGFQVLDSTGALKTSPAGVLGDPVAVPHGGTGLATLTAHGLLVGEGVSTVALVGPGATNTVLHGAGAGADPSFSAVVEGDLSLSDVTTADVSITKHGFAPKAPNDATKYLDGTAAYSTPLGASIQVDAATSIFSSSVQPRCSAWNSAAVNVSSATITTLSLDSEEYDVGNMHSTSVNTSRVTCPTGGGGLYFAVGQTQFAANGTGARRIYLNKNGSNVAVLTQGNSGASRNTNIQVSWIGILAPTDYLEIAVFQESGTTLAVGDTVAATANRLQVVKLW